MPTYTFKCPKHGEFDFNCSYESRPNVVCPICGKDSMHIFCPSDTAIHIPTSFKATQKFATADGEEIFNIDNYVDPEIEAEERAEQARRDAQWKKNEEILADVMPESLKN